MDDVLDDVFGQPDDRGPGPIDGVLVVGGLGAIIGGQVASWPSVVTVAGAAALALGAVLPLRSAWHRIASTRRSRRLTALLGDGVLLRTDDPGIGQLLDANERLLSTTSKLSPGPRGRVRDVAHAAVLEVATLLGGRLPSAGEVVDYVAARTHALEELAAAVADPRVGDGESNRTRAIVEARREIEQLSGSSSLTDASDLSRELLGTDEP
jgi:hypothetical protein